MLFSRSKPAGVGRRLSIRRSAQRLEDAARFALLWLVTQAARVVWRRARQHAKRPERVLFICEDAIGDLILTLPAIRAIATSRPGITVDLVTSSYAADLVQHLPYIRQTIVFPRYQKARVSAAIEIFRHGRYDVVVDGMVLRSHVRTRSIAMMVGARTPVWIGECGRANDHVYSVRVAPSDPSTPHAERMMHLATAFSREITRPSLRCQLHVTHAERAVAGAMWRTAQGTGDRILVNISASCPERRWADEHFEMVLDQVRRLRPAAPLVVVGLSSDARSVMSLAASAGGLGVIPTLRELLALVATTDVVLSPDTSVCHMAAAFERTLISLNLRDHEVWAPAATPGVRVIGPSDQTLDGLQPDAVVAAVTGVLRARFRGSRWVAAVGR